ncbi:MAG: TrpB-like pyridoxal-phosphate dependent enzyme, partial [Oscillospiraceae bacterium]|nr:TrpB-like pyridoxal-phosphate dependent enzyme [Oscillospiraceae bacterium]
MKNQEIPYKIYLEEQELPKQWHNVRAAMKEKPEPFIHPGTGKECTKEDLLPVFCEE